MIRSNLGLRSRPESRRCWKFSSRRRVKSLCLYMFLAAVFFLRVSSKQAILSDGSEGAATKENDLYPRAMAKPTDSSPLPPVNDLSSSTALENNTATSFEFTYFSNKPECTPLRPEQASATLVTQLSMDRIWIMKYQCQRWPAPYKISVAVFLTGSATEKLVLDLLGTTFQCHLNRMKVTFLQSNAKLSDYPVNALRNLAIEGVSTTHAVYMDSDFLISEGLHDHVLQSIQQVADDPKAAIVVPVFEYLSTCTLKETEQDKIVQCLEKQWDTAIPKTKQDLVPLLENVHRPKVRRGYQNTNGKNRYHSTTMYRRWMEDQTTILPIPCFKSKTYEPYLVVRVCNQLPDFPTVFTGYGWNKMIWIQILLHKFGYSLWQIPHGFALHMPHAESKARETDLARKTEGETAATTAAPSARDAYLKWFWSNPDHPNKLPTCQAYKQQQK